MSPSRPFLRQCLALATLLCASAAQAHGPTPVPVFNPSALKGPAQGKPNEVMVLGTVHLSQLPAPFQPASLAALNDRLAAWQPHIIATEDRSGPQCAWLRQYPHRYKEVAESFCSFDPAPAQAATGLDMPGATAEIDRLLAAWPATPTPAQRRRLAAVFLAGGEPVSALVQWLRLPEAERRTGDGLDAGLVATLEKQRTRRNESQLIAAALAARLGLERVYGMDDMTSAPPDIEPAAFEAAIRKAWNNPAAAERRQLHKAWEATLGDAAGVLALYRAVNAPAEAQRAFASDFGANLNEPSPQQFGRIYLGGWETRNLRMAANIRDAIALRPGSRTLVIVGASHKGYLEAYLHQMHDVHVVSTDRVLQAD